MALTDKLNAIGNAIRAKTGKSGKLTLDQMVTEINGIKATLQNKTVTPTKTQSTINADAGYDGLGTVTVNAIPSEYIVPSGSATKTENGTYDVTSLAQLVVNVNSGGGLPSGISAIKMGTHTVSSDVAYGTAVNITHNLGVIPDLFIVYATSNTAVTYSELFMVRGTEIMYRGSSYHTLVAYRGNSTTSASATFANSSQGGIYSLTATKATMSGHQSSYYVRSGTWKWIAIKFG